MKKTNLTKEQESDIIKLYISGFNLEKVSLEYKISTWKVSEILKRHSIKRRTNKIMRRRFSCYSDYFNEIDTKDKAYFLGLMYADGWNNEKSRQIALQLKDSDRKVIYLFKEYLQYTGNIVEINRRDKEPTHSNITRLAVVDDNLSTNLARLGCVQNKTFQIEDIPEEIPNELISHFIRGYFDGDGSIHNDITTNNLKFQIVGNQTMLQRLIKELVINCGVNNNKIYGRKRTKLMAFGGNIVCKRIYDYLYKDCDDLFIDRKKETFENKWKSYYQ